MRLRLRRRVLPLRELEQHALDALGREVLLGERHAAVEHLAVALDQVIAEAEEADALEQHGPALRARHARGVAEAVARVADFVVAQRIEEVPAEIRAGLVKVRQHAGDGLAPLVGAEETVVINTVYREQAPEPRAVICRS